MRLILYLRYLKSQRCIISELLSQIYCTVKYITAWVLAALRTLALWAPVFLGLLIRKKWRCAPPPPPRPSQFRYSSPEKICEKFKFGGNPRTSKKALVKDR